MKRKIILNLPAIIFLLAACSSSKIISSWVQPGILQPTYRHILVWGILPEKDNALRSKMETHLVNDLKKKGFAVTAATQVYSDTTFYRLTGDEIVAKFKNTGVDAVITITLLNKDVEKLYIPPSVSWQPTDDYAHLGRYVANEMKKVYSPGYYATSIKYFWQCNLYSVADAKLIYAAKTNSFNPSSKGRQAHEHGLLIINDMIAKGLITPLPAEE